MTAGRHINHKGMLGIILLILTPLSIFKLPNTTAHVKVDLLFGLWCVFIGWLLWSGWDRN